MELYKQSLFSLLSPTLITIDNNIFGIKPVKYYTDKSNFYKVL